LDRTTLDNLMAWLWITHRHSHFLPLSMPFTVQLKPLSYRRTRALKSTKASSLISSPCPVNSETTIGCGAESNFGRPGVSFHTTRNFFNLSTPLGSSFEQCRTVTVLSCGNPFRCMCAIAVCSPGDRANPLPFTTHKNAEENKGLRAASKCYL
jgi:hypothetical protein